MNTDVVVNPGVESSYVKDYFYQWILNIFPRALKSIDHIMTMKFEG